MSEAPGGSLNQQRIVVRSDDGAGEGVAAVQTDAEAAAAAVGNQLAGIGHKVVGRVLGGNTALDSMADGCQLILLRQGDFRAVQVVALGNLDLCLYNVDTGNLLGNGVLNLNAGVNLDEVELAVGSSQKFYGAGADVVNIFHQLDSSLADSFALFYRQSEGRSNFNQLLVAALYGAVALKQMH